MSVKGPDTPYKIDHSFVCFFDQTPIEKLQNHQEVLKEEVLSLKSKLKTVLDHTTHLEAMMKALVKHHGVSVEEEEEGEDDD